MTSSLLSPVLGDWNASPDFARELAARVSYVYAPGDGAWSPTSDALAGLLGWPPEWEVRVEEAQVRADATCAGCTFLDVRGRDPQRPQDELGTTIAVSGW